MSIYGYTVSANVKELEIIVRSWCNTFIVFSDISGTVPHQSKPEETNVGIFIGAAWKNGWVAFQEVACKKKDINNGHGYGGYCDIWLKNNSSKSYSYYAECKGGIIETQSQAKKLIGDAVRDVQRLIIEEEQTRTLALAFCNIQFRGRVYEQNPEQKIKEIIEAVGPLDSDIFAYSFPVEVRRYNDEGFYYPGVIMLGQSVG